MRTVDLYRCERCKLEWVKGSDRIEGRCPACWTHHGAPLAPVVISGRRVQVDVVHAYGSDYGLLDARVRKGLGVLNLGDHCEHGYMTTLICPECKINCQHY